jgi:hypothetical protein
MEMRGNKEMGEGRGGNAPRSQRSGNRQFESHKNNNNKCDVETRHDATVPRRERKANQEKNT